MLYGEAQELFAPFADRGWSDATKLCLLAEFVSQVGLQKALQQFLTSVAAEEESERPTEPPCPTRKSIRKSATPDGTGRNVYLIRQQLDHLDGEYLVAAVVIAAGPGRAVKDLLRHVRAHRPHATARRCRLSVVRIGENAPAHTEPLGVNDPGAAATVVAVVFGEDDG